MVTEETTRIVEISRVNVEFIARAWGKTRFSPRINFAQQQLVDYTMDIQVDMTWEMADGMFGYSACCIKCLLAQLTEDELWDPEALEQIVRRQQRALKRDSARRSALLAAGIDDEY
eukprot:jgi/Tetstr1/438073/TSEL_026698.t1